MALMKRMVASGEADYLVPERVWQEFSKGLSEEHAERMFEVLQACGLHEKLLHEVKAIPKKLSGSLPMRFALLAWPLEEGAVNSLCERLRAPNEVRELALLASRNRERLRAARGATPQALLDLLKRTDALRRPERFGELLEVARLAEPDIDTRRIDRARQAAAGVDAGAIAAGAAPTDIPQLVDQARVRAITQAT
jgi:tRNA nucleotidyltransferase (CCA-adding enzyme)